MKRKFLFLFGALSMLFASQAVAQDMEAMMELMKPGPEHDFFKQFEGEWDMSVKMWMPGQAEMSSQGTSTQKLILGGRFLEFHATSGTGAMAWESITILGFDRRHKKYTSVGFDTWGTYYVTAEGSYDEEKKLLRLYGEDQDPVMGMQQKYYFVFTWTGKDTFKLEVIFVDFPGVEEKEYKMIEINYRRK